MTLQRININEEKRLQVIWNNAIVLFQENTAVDSRLSVCVHSRKSNLVICDTTTSWGRLIFFVSSKKKNPSERRCYSEILGSPEEHVISTNRGGNSQSVGTGQLTGHLKIIPRHDTWHWLERPWKTQNSRLLLFFCSTGKTHIGAGGKPQFNANRSVMTSWHPVLECHFFLHMSWKRYWSEDTTSIWGSACTFS